MTEPTVEERLLHFLRNEVTLTYDERAAITEPDVTLAAHIRQALDSSKR